MRSESARPAASRVLRQEPEWLARLRRASGICAWIVLAIVCAGSLLPQSALPEHLPSASLLHFVAYGTPAALAAFAAGDARRAFAAAVAILAVSLAMEAAQAMIPGRFAEFRDAAFNTAGVISGLAVGRAAAHLMRLSSLVASR